MTRNEFIRNDEAQGALMLAAIAVICGGLAWLTYPSAQVLTALFSLLGGLCAWGAARAAREWVRGRP